jgi:uncharacterized membrane protein
LLERKPDDPIPHILQFLDDKRIQSGSASQRSSMIPSEPLTPEERDELEHLREEHRRLQDKVAKLKAGSSSEEAKVS